jgi:ribonuclease T2
MRKAAFAALLLTPTSAQAQAYQCQVPARIEQGAPPRQDGPTRRAPVGGFTLAASWSPEYCHGARGEAGSMQCSGRAGRFGFVLHGLWPEAANGPAPQWCALNPRPSPEELRRNLCMTPSPGLLEHEWAKHGSCMAKTPDAYFAMARAAWRRVEWPDADALSRRHDLKVGELRAAFIAANPGWRAEQVSIQLTLSGWLREVQLCFGADRKPQACPRFRRGAADAKPLKIWRGF